MEFLSLLCHLLIIGLSAALPLYTGGTYWKLGDTKYILFRNLTVFCLGVWLAVSICETVRSLVLRRKSAADGLPEDRQDGAAVVIAGADGVMPTDCGQTGKGKALKFSSMDVCMLCYGAAVVLSAVLSMYKVTAWRGYSEWYMGALSQLIFTGIYFFISRHFDRRQYSLLLGGTALFAVFGLGICHRLGVDPTGLLGGFDIRSWEYDHMLSTIGNINWFCGYCSVALAFPVAVFLKAGKRRIRWGAYVISIMGLSLLMIQGSDIGVILVAVCLFACMLAGINDGGAFRRTVALETGTAFLLAIYGTLRKMLGERAWEAVPDDGFARALAGWQGWWLLGALGLGLYMALGRMLRGEKKERVLKRITAGIMILTVLAGIAGVLLFTLQGSFEGGWGNGRGALWKASLQSFWQGDFLQKMFGVGPDCFAEYIYSAVAVGELPGLSGRWAGTVFANAHNEWLNHLVNIGLAGTACYLGIFLTGIKRYRRYLPGFLALILYGTVSLTGFQQVLSTPLLFMTLGIAESSMKGEIFSKVSKNEGKAIQ